MTCLTLAILAATLVVCAAQTTMGPTPTAADAGAGGGSNMGLLTYLRSIQSPNPPATAAPSPTTSSNNINNNNNNNQGKAGTSSFSQLLRNPMMRYMLAGPENIMRAYAMPYLSKLGLPGSNAAQMSFLWGGFENYMDYMVSDMIRQGLSRSGMDPMTSLLFTSQMEAPDSYLRNNMFFNQMGGGQTGQRTSSPKQSGGPLSPQQAAAPPGSLPPGAASAGAGPSRKAPYDLATLLALSFM